MRLCDHFELDMIAGSAQHPAVTLARTEGRTREDCPMCKLGHLPTDRFAVCTSSLQLHTIQAIHALVIGIPGNLQRVDSPVPINLPPQSFATSSEATLGVSSCAKPSLPLGRTWFRTQGAEAHAHPSRAIRAYTAATNEDIFSTQYAIRAYMYTAATNEDIFSTQYLHAVHCTRCLNCRAEPFKLSAAAPRPRKKA